MLDEHVRRVWLGCVLSVLAACGGMDSDRAMTGRHDSAGARADKPAALPPLRAADVEDWLETGAYEDWHCEPAVHASRPPSPHGWNRICSNDVIAAKAKGRGDWPKGAAAVKELYTSESAQTPAGYSLYVKTEDDSAGGASWYWYERLPPSESAPDEPGQLVADGMGDSGPAKEICVACHTAAGSDPAHTPSAGGRDQVYTPVD